MVERILNLLHREIRGLHEAAYVLGLFAFFSTVLALVRDRLLAHIFGAGATLDIYYASFRLPDLVFVSIASMVSIYVLIPFLTVKGDDVQERQRRFIGNVFSAFFASIVIVSALLFAAAPRLLPYLFPGLVDSPLFGDLVLLTRLLLLQPIFLGISNIFASITQVYGRFLLFAVAPLFYNLGIIVGALFWYPQFGILGLGYGVVLGAILHASVQLPFIIRGGFLSRMTVRLRFRELRNVIVLSLPRTLALSVNHVALLVLAGIASVMAEGSITVFNFSFNLQAAPLSIIGASYSVAAFPTLARLFSSGERGTFIVHMTTAARHIIFWSVPIVVLFVVLRAQIVRVVLGSGAFDWSDTRLTAAALALFAISLAAQGLSLLFVRGYYAAGNTLKPLLVNVFSALLIVALAFGLTKLFASSALWRYFVESLLRVEDIPGTAILMLPLGYSLALIIQAGIFWFLFQRESKEFSKVLSRVTFEVLSASIVMGFIVHWLLDVLGNLFDLNSFWGIFAQGFFAGSIGILCGILLWWVLGSREIREIHTSLRHKFWKTPTVGVDETEL